MLVAWNVVVGVAVSLWILLRLVHQWTQRRLRVQAAKVAHARDRDEWVATRRSAWEAQFRLLEARADAFAEVFKPLEL
jgi:hypothetical protein